MTAILLILIIGSQPEDDPAPLHNPAPYLHLAVLFFTLFFGLALTNSWWSVWRADDLLARTDNPRRSISDLYVARGDLVDRTLQPIVVTKGEPGSFIRSYLYPELSPVTGYINNIFGLSGLELSLDPYLRGLQGNPALLIWWNRLLYGTPPPGSTARLSLDLQLQTVADELLEGRKGSAILLNARTGEILVMASHPTYDPNRLSETGSQLLGDPDSPLLNRAAQGSYPPGNILSLMVKAKELEAGKALSRQELVNLYTLLGLYQNPQINLPVSNSSPIGETDKLRISPLQAALAATALANDGKRSPGQIVTGLESQESNWVILTPDRDPISVLDPAAVNQATENALVRLQPYWRVIDETAPSGSGIAWFLGGTPSGWQGTPLIAVVALEDGNAADADYIGQELLKAALEK
jgi:cell division protein FtsI/penicillin-binding protein 2